MGLTEFDCTGQKVQVCLPLPQVNKVIDPLNIVKVDCMTFWLMLLLWTKQSPVYTVTIYMLLTCTGQGGEAVSFCNSILAICISVSQ